MDQLIVTCTRGFEEYTAKEIFRLGCRPSELRQGRVIINGDMRCVYRLNNYSRTANRVLLLLSRRTVKGIDDVYSAFYGLDYSFIMPGQSFAIRAERSAEGGISSLDIARTGGQALIDSYMNSRGSRLRVDLENPDVVVRGDLVGNELFISIDTTGPSLHIREYRRFNHPSSIKPTLASALIYMSGWDGGSLLDPFAGGGTIPIEAALIASGERTRPSGNFLYKGLSFYNKEEEEAELDSTWLRFRAERITGIEINRKYYTGAVKNAEAAGVLGTVELIHGDSLRAELGQRFRYLVSNPPYGIRSGRKERVVGLYRAFMKRIRGLVEPGGTCVMVTTEHKRLKEAAEEEGFDVLKVSTGLHGRLYVGAVMFRL